VPAAAGTNGNGAEHGLGGLRPTRTVKAVAPSARRMSALPAAVDLKSYTVPVGNQGSIGSCVAWAIDYAMLGLYAKRAGMAVQSFHPMYTYSQIHIDNTPTGGGSYPSDALNVALAEGNDSMSDYAHSLTDFVNLPTASEEANAANFKISGWQTLFAYATGGGGNNGISQIKTALAAGKPVAIGLPVRPGFDNMANSSTTLDTDTTGTSRGNHEVLATGYDQSGLWIQNSWGTGWGYGGFGRLSWQVVSQDVYSAHTISGFAAAPTGDTTPPAMGSVVEQFAVNQTVSSSTEPVNFSWSATDPSGIAAYAVYVKTDNGSYVQDTTVPATATQVTYSLSMGHTYQVAVAAKDGVGNWSGYAYGKSVAVGIVDDTAFSTTTQWGRYSLADTYGGTYMAASQAGATFQYTFNGRDVGLVGPRFSTAGKATLYCDGTSFGLVDEYNASTVGRQVIAWCRFAQTGQHTIKVVVQGTSGRPWFGVDAFATLT
jgi:hypothetical protein